MKEIYRSNNPIQLSWCQSVLDEHDIPYIVSDQNMGALMRGIGNVYTRVLVPDDQVTKALILLKKIDNTDT